MMEFLVAHQEIAWVVFVFVFCVIAAFLTLKILHFTEKKWKRAGDFESVFKALTRISKLFYVFLFFGLISYLLFEKSAFASISENIGRIFWFGIVATITVVTVAISQDYFHRRMNKLSSSDTSDITMYKYLNYLITAIIYLFGIILIGAAVPAFRNFAAAAGAGAGVFALIAGVAAQEGISNLIGGLFIAFFKPFRIGDIVRIGADVMGVVEDVNLRHTVINNFQNKRVLIPNAIVNKETIINYHLGTPRTCEWIEVGISYQSNIDQAMAIIKELCEAHPNCIDNRTLEDIKNHKPKVDVQVIGLGNSSVNLKAWAWAPDYRTGFQMRNELYKQIKQKFDTEGISIPFPHTSIVFENALKHEYPK